MNKPIDLSSHPILQQAFDVIQAIEKCGASVELTNAVTKAGELMTAINELIAIRELKGDQVPVALVDERQGSGGFCLTQHGRRLNLQHGTELFTAPKKLVVLHDERDHYQDTDEYEQGYVRGWNASRREAKAAIEAAGGLVKDGE